MPTYPVINRETGEQKEVTMSFTVWNQWLEDTPGRIRDWSDPSTAPMATEVGDWRNKLVSRKPGWNEVLEKASHAPGSRVKKI